MIEESENIVKKTCRELGITQKELAEIMGVSKQSVSYWANNKIQPPKILEKIVELLLIQKQYFMIRKLFLEIDSRDLTFIKQ